MIYMNNMNYDYYSQNNLQNYLSFSIFLTRFFYDFIGELILLTIFTPFIAFTIVHLLIIGLYKWREEIWHKKIPSAKKEGKN